MWRGGKSGKIKWPGQAEATDALGEIWAVCGLAVVAFQLFANISGIYSATGGRVLRRVGLIDDNGRWPQLR
jgi:hypothetical protein